MQAVLARPSRVVAASASIGCFTPALALGCGGMPAAGSA